MTFGQGVAGGDLESYAGYLYRSAAEHQEALKQAFFEGMWVNYTGTSVSRGTPISKLQAPKPPPLRGLTLGEYLGDLWV